MLMLSRRIGESLVIGHEVTLTVLGIKGTQVRLGIKAPRDIPVHREEIWQRILQEQTDGDHVEAIVEMDLGAEESVNLAKTDKNKDHLDLLLLPEDEEHHSKSE